VATATHKAVEVYERLVVRVLVSHDSHISFLVIYSQTIDPENPPDLVIAGKHRRNNSCLPPPDKLFHISISLGPADTIVLTHVQPITSDISYSLTPGIAQEVLEKPSSKQDNLRMLLDLNGGVCEVVTGVTIGEYTPFPSLSDPVNLLHCIQQYTPFYLPRDTQ
jgi:septum formation protein